MSITNASGVVCCDCCGSDGPLEPDGLGVNDYCAVCMASRRGWLAGRRAAALFQVGAAVEAALDFTDCSPAQVRAIVDTALSDDGLSHDASNELAEVGEDEGGES